MNPEKPSGSAMAAAVARGTHRLWDARPWIMDDPFALVLVGPSWPEFAAGTRRTDDLRPSALERLVVGVVVEGCAHVTRKHPYF